MRLRSSFLPLAALVQDPVETVLEMGRREGRIGLPHPAIPLPAELYRGDRLNSGGLDLANDQQLSRLHAVLQASVERRWQAAPMVVFDAAAGESQPLCNPADGRDVVGHVP